jgi:ribosomal protein S18 acetylase RimI-like enzyme
LVIERSPSERGNLLNFTFNMIEIRPALKNPDYSQIEALAHKIWREHYIPILGKAQVDYMLVKYQSVVAIEKQIADGFEYFILNFDENPVGYVAIKLESEALFLSKFYVLKEFRGKKIGKSTMLFVEEKAKTYQSKTIRLTVNTNNTIAINAYEKLGFKNVGASITDIGNGFVMDDYLMIKHSCEGRNLMN